MRRFQIVSTLLFLLLCASSGSAEDLASRLRYSSANMLPTIAVGALLRVERSYYDATTPQRGDIVLFRLPDDPRTRGEDESKHHYVSRVIAVSGDTIEIKKTRVILNGETLSETFVQWSSGGWKDFPETRVPENSVFLLGDNRDVSKDSRFFKDTFVPQKDILGKVFVD